ncbi:unnamed protein product [Ambrosiozyma monospora]|uniref:Unnamed protein product n=1 Tax=Ambrosiozyma monospora TaxID=43982 RepID=A0ACB5TEW7_AMBMO|nr:unnamed protein product [Ambrosiozyma monospora]
MEPGDFVKNNVSYDQLTCNGVSYLKVPGFQEKSMEVAKRGHKKPDGEDTAETEPKCKETHQRTHQTPESKPLSRVHIRYKSQFHKMAKFRLTTGVTCAFLIAVLAAFSTGFYGSPIPSLKCFSNLFFGFPNNQQDIPTTSRADSPNNMTYSPLFQTCKQCNDLVESFLNNPAPYTSLSPSPYPEFHNEDLHFQTQKQVRNTINVISEALEKFSLDELSISYNGGKDCLVMLIIYLSTIYSHFAKNNIDGLTNTKLHSVYINSEATFPEQDQFLDESVERYNLNITKYENCSLVDGFREYLDENKNVKAIMVGIRKIDPYGATLSNFNRTDHGWPDFIRVHPILQFTTCEIWFFLKSLDIPYCELYDLKEWIFACLYVVR